MHNSKIIKPTSICNYLVKLNTVYSTCIPININMKLSQLLLICLELIDSSTILPTILDITNKKLKCLSS